MTDNVFDFSDDINEGEERVGGFSLLPSNIFKLRITQAYMILSKNGAKGVVIDAETPEGHKHSQTFYITNKNGQPYYEKDGKKTMLPSMTTINNLAKLLGFKNFGEVYNARVKKAGTVYDWESRKEITKELEKLVKLEGKIIAAAIVHRKENKTKLVGKDYKPTNEAREFNEILAFLDKKTNRTATEVADDKDAKYAADFLSKYENQIDDRFKPVEEDFEDTDASGVDPLATDNEDDDDFL